MGNIADLTISVGLGIALGVVSGVLIAIALTKPIEWALDNYEVKAYSKVWKEG